MDAKQLVAQMTLEEKASLCSGKDMWFTKAVERLGVPSVMVTDGPHGLRKQKGGTDHLGINESVPATCFPTASATACSWDRDLLHHVGVALAQECIANDVAVILGPGANIKRSPLCGRNFEYISEDPYLSGELAAAIIQGVQSLGVGTSLKHFAVNNQEERRMTIDAVVDERTLREIYLTGFEKAVKQAQPYTVMCSYNRLDGIYASEYGRLLSDILRDEWGFEGLVVTDWGACNDRVDGLAAGQDLEMPGSGGLNDAKIVEAVRAGRLSEAVLDRAAERIATLVLRWADHAPAPCDLDANHRLARSAAAQSVVLLKNEGGLLPLGKSARVAVVGAFAKHPRYQGSGSSLIAPTKLECAWEEITRYAPEAIYADGYSQDSDQPREALIEEACRAAAAADVVLVFAGLPDAYESEGFDREHMRMPEAHNALIARVAKANPRTIVVLSNGAPMEMPWLSAVPAALEGYLGGQAGAGGVADVLFGAVNPSGKLAETFPMKLEDVLSTKWFPMGPKTVEYREGLFVGYRWFDTAKVAPMFPFGHGLSYTAFAYEDLQVQDGDVAAGEPVRVSFTLRNTGNREGAEVVQLYVRAKNSPVIRPDKELKGFDKAFMEPGETKRVTLELDARAFAFYNTAISDWYIASGDYELLLGASSADIRLQGTVTVQGEEAPLPELPAGSVYRDIARARGGISDGDFAALLGRPIPSRQRAAGDAYDSNSTLGDVKSTFVGKLLNKFVMDGVKKMAGKDPNASMYRMIVRMIESMPLRALWAMVMMSQGAMTPDTLDGLLLMMNGHGLLGLRRVISAGKKKK